MIPTSLEWAHFKYLEEKPKKVSNWGGAINCETHAAQTAAAPNAGAQPKAQWINLYDVVIITEAECSIITQFWAVQFS